MPDDETENGAPAARALLRRVHQLAEPGRAALRFRQGRGSVLDGPGLAAAIRTDQPVALVEPVEAPLAWSEPAARRWAGDCVERALAAAGDEDTRALRFAIDTARQFADGGIDAAILDAVFAELFVEEWPTYEGPFFALVQAVRQLTARDPGERSPAGRGVIRAGEWAAAAARAALAAASATGDPAAERAWQVARLYDYLMLDP